MPQVAELADGDFLAKRPVIASKSRRYSSLIVAEQIDVQDASDNLPWSHGDLQASLMPANPKLFAI